MSFGEPLMAGTLPETATSRFEDSSEKWWANWRERRMNARSYGRYEQSTTATERFFKKHLMTIWLLIGAIFALMYYAIGMTVTYISDEHVTPWLQLRKEQRARRDAVKQATRRMVQSDLE